MAVRANFFSGKSEMEAILRLHNWEHSPLGSIDNWSQSLKTSLNILLRSGTPMMLFWGKDLVGFYNDAYKVCPGADADALAMPARLAWKNLNADLIQVLQSGKPFTKQHAFVEDPNSDGQESFWNFCYSIVPDEAGNNAGVMVVCNEIIDLDTTLQLNKIEPKLSFAIEAAGLGTWDYNILTKEFSYNHRLREWLNVPADQIFTFEYFLRNVFAADRERMQSSINAALAGKNNGSLYETYRLPILHADLLRMVQLTGKVWFNEAGVAYRITGVSQDITDQSNHLQMFAEKEELFRIALEGSKQGTFDFNPVTGALNWDNRTREIFGLSAHAHLDYSVYKSALHPDFDTLTTTALTPAALKANNGMYEVEYQITGIEDLQNRWVCSRGKVSFDSNGQPVRYTGMVQDITTQKDAEAARLRLTAELEQSQQNFRSIVEQAPLGIAIFKGKNFVAEVANDAYLELVDKNKEHFIGRPLFDVLPEVEEIVRPLLTKVLETAMPFIAEEFPVRLSRYGVQSGLSYFNLIYHPIKNAEGGVESVAVVANEVTSLVLQKQQLSRSEQAFRMLVMQSPIAMAIIRGEEMRIEMANDAMLNFIWRKKREDVLGKNLLEAFPELVSQKYPDLLKEVMIQNRIQSERESKAIVTGDDGEREFWVDYNYHPLPNAQGVADGLMITVNDVTDRVLARKRVEESEQRSRLAIEAAGLGTFDWDLSNNHFECEEKLKEIFGFDPALPVSHDQLLATYLPEDRPRRDAAVDIAKKTGALIYETRVVQPKGNLRWLRVFGKVKFDKAGTPLKIYGTVLDISDDKENTAALENSTARLNIAIDTAELGTWELNMKSHQPFYSARYLEILGFDPADKPTADQLLHRIHPADLPHRNEMLKKALLTGSLDMELRILPDEHTMRWVMAKGKVFYDEQNMPEKILGTLMDITETKNSMNMLLESEQRFRNVANNAPVLIWMSGTDMGCNYFNTAWLNFTGRTMEQEAGNGWAEGVHPDDFERCLKIYTTHFAMRTPFYMEYRLRRHDGMYRWLSDNGAPRFTADGIFEGFIGACSDIHDTRTAAEKIEKSELLFKTISNVSPVGLWMADVKGNCSFVNDTWINWTGIPFNEQLGQGFVSAIHADDRHRIFNVFLECQVTQSKCTEEFRLHRPDGSIRWCLNDGSPFFDAQGNYAGYAGSVTDITEKKMVEVELERKIAERTAALEKSNSELEQFAYVASHDLQEPLRKIKFFTERLEGRLAADVQAKEYFSKIQRSSDRMNTLIRDLLDFSRLSTADEKFVRTDLAVVVENILHDFELLIAQKNATLEIDPLPVIEAVPLQMQQLFFNLVNNALKFSKPGVDPHISISCAPASAEEIAALQLHKDLSYIHIRVADNGIGFEQEYAQQIFVIFQRLNDMYTYSGTGIGLALCRKIALNHKGSIYAKGIENEGATFHLILPATQQL